ncbi:MAG: GNAT family N-acetyltransferase [Gammaproteobacteria bacterium]|nr:GNAT family N-acetyltransferase [Gammaproteobacteria bacterium]
MHHNPSFSISPMTQAELNDFALAWAAAEGWNPGLHDAESFYPQDPQGFFIGRLDQEVIATAAGVIYDDNFAFFGFYFVKADFRGQGYGMQMTQKRLAYVGDRIVGLDGVLTMCDKYANIGFRLAHMNIRQQGIAPSSVNVDPHISKILPSMFPEILTYDRQCFPAPRPAFLSKWLNPKEGMAVAYCDNSQVKGYGVIRKTVTGYKVGPLFADDQKVANAILSGLLSTIPNETFFLDTPEPNSMALALAASYKTQACFKTLRMYRNGMPDLDLNKVFGITTFELG